MGTPTHTYCSLRDLLKNKPSPIPKFKNHSYSRTRAELQDLYTNMSLDLSFLESPSPPSLSKKVPSSHTNNAGHGNGKLCAIEKRRMVESSNGCIYNPEKSKKMLVEEKIDIDSQDVMLAPNENEHLKMSFADNGAKEDAEKEEMEKEGVMESEKEIEEKGMVESEVEIEEEEEGMLESKE